MSKGTKQIRLGRVERFVEKLEFRLEGLKDICPELKNTQDKVNGMISELERTIDELKKEFLWMDEK